MSVLLLCKGCADAGGAFAEFQARETELHQIEARLLDLADGEQGAAIVAALREAHGDEADLWLERTRMMDKALKNIKVGFVEDGN